MISFSGMECVSLLVRIQNTPIYIEDCVHTLSSIYDNLHFTEGILQKLNCTYKQVLQVEISGLTLPTASIQTSNLPISQSMVLYWFTSSTQIEFPEPKNKVNVIIFPSPALSYHLLYIYKDLIKGTVRPDEIGLSVHCKPFRLNQCQIRNSHTKYDLYIIPSCG